MQGFCHTRPYSFSLFGAFNHRDSRVGRGGIYIPPGYCLHGLYLTDTKRTRNAGYLRLKYEYTLEVCPSPNYLSRKSKEFYHAEFVLMPKDDGSDEGVRLPTDEPGGYTYGVEWYIQDPAASRHAKAFKFEWELCRGDCARDVNIVSYVERDKWAYPSLGQEAPGWTGATHMEYTYLTQNPQYGFV